MNKEPKRGSVCSARLSQNIEELKLQTDVIFFFHSSFFGVDNFSIVQPISSTGV